MPTEMLSKEEHRVSSAQPFVRRVSDSGLSLEHVSKRFASVQALVDCSFSVGRGRMLGFLGPNGAGKTTAMRAVFGLVQVDAGEVLWRRRPVGFEERLRFGYMPEERGLYPRMPVREQLEYFGRLHGLMRARGARCCGEVARATRACGPRRGEGGGALAREPAARAACGRAGA